MVSTPQFPDTCHVQLFTGDVDMIHGDNNGDDNDDDNGDDGDNGDDDDAP